MSYKELSSEVKVKCYQAVCRDCSYEEFLESTGLESSKESYGSYTSLRQKAKRNGLLELRHRRGSKRALPAENNNNNNVTDEAVASVTVVQSESDIITEDKKFKSVSLDVRLANSRSFREAKCQTQSQVDSLNKEIELLRKNVAVVQNKIRALTDERDKAQKRLDALTISEYVIRTMTDTL